MEERFVKNIRMLADENNDMIAKQASDKHNDPLPITMVVAIISALTIVIFLIGLAVTRYYPYFNRWTKNSSTSSYSISRYWRRQFPSISFDSLLPSPPLNATHPATEEVSETTRIIKNSFSWPEATLLHQQQQLDKVECSSTISSLSTSSTMEHLLAPASLTFSLRWNEFTGSLFVRIINARDLRNRQGSLIDSYVRLEVISTENDTIQEPFQSMRTHIIKKNAHPVYDELFEFSHLQQIYQQTKLSLNFTILTYDTFTRDEILGQVIFPIIFPNETTLTSLDTTETTFTQDITPRQQQLTNQQLGQILLSLCYQPIDSTITFIVLKASNLPRIRTTRLINPYFKIYMFYKGQRIVKKRSTIKRTCRCPVYNECFVFHIPDNDLQNIHFNLILFDYDGHMKHEPIGMLSIGNHSNEINQHWNDVCHRQIAKQIAQWYQLKPFNRSNY